MVIALIILAVFNIAVLGGLFLLYREMLSLSTKSDNHFADIGKEVVKLDNKVVKLENEIKRIHQRIDKIFVVDKPSPNHIEKKKDDLIEFSERTPLELPKNFKIDVEGGDSTIPYGYT